MPELKGSAVVINRDHKFLLYDGRSWGTTDNQFFHATWPNAVRAARALPQVELEAGVYVVTDYGYTSEEWKRVTPAGDFERCEPIPHPPTGEPV